MANLRMSKSPLQRDPVLDETNPPDQPDAPINTIGGTPGGAGSGLKPIELNPGSGNLPTSPREPQVGAGPVASMPLGDGSSSVGQVGAGPVGSLPMPRPQSMVFPRQQGGKLFGARGGQFGGGLALGADQTQQGPQESSDLIMSLLQLLSQNQGQ